MWTHFWDMNSGGSQKEKWAHIYIEAPEKDAIVIFETRFGHAYNNVTCPCCGDDYAINGGGNLSQLTAFQRGCAWDGFKYYEKPDRGNYISLGDYMASEGNEYEFPATRLFIFSNNKGGDPQG